MDQNAANANDGSRLRRSANRIAQQKRAQSLPLPRPIDSQTSHHRHRKRIGHVSPQPCRRLTDRDPARRQTVITDNPPTLGRHIGPRRAGRLIGPGTISGAFELLNLGQITGLPGPVTIDTGTFDNQGLVEGNVTIGASVDLLDEANGTLTAGTWSPSGDIISLPGSAITVDDADIDLSAGTLNAGSTSVVNSLTQIGTAGTLMLSAVGGQNVTFSQPLIDSGVLSAPDAGLSVAELTIASGGELIVQDVTFESGLTLFGVVATQNLGEGYNLPLSIIGTGTIQVNSGVNITGPRTLTQTIVNDGAVIIQNSGSGPGVKIANPSFGNGTFYVEAGTLELESGTSNTVSFDSLNGSHSAAAAVLDEPAAFDGTIYGMANTIDSVVLDGVIGTTATLNGGTLSVLNGAGTVAALIVKPLAPEPLFAPGQSYAGAVFTATPDTTADNTTITVSGVTDVFACFRSGTRIATPGGTVAVERLAAGDRILTGSGDVRRIIWTGHRTIDCRGHRTPSRVWPVRISPNAFGPDQPSRDLFLSPDHAVFVDGVLIPVRYLLNGKTIRQIATERVTYHHIELEQHDVVLAEGLAAESYLNNGDRRFFADGDLPAPPFLDLGGKVWDMMACAPLVITGPVLVQARAMLERRANGGILEGPVTAELTAGFEHLAHGEIAQRHERFAPGVPSA
jgi:hypothetical protein